ncbi:MAG TPA: hypothetical protein PKY96_05960 [Flavobacteriales bacterium]|nr:hypothetical protein [Flavobacteriales bacterium]
MRDALIAVLVLAMVQFVNAQSALPDFHGESCDRAVGFWVNDGQLLGTNGLPCPAVKCYSEGTAVTVFCSDSSRVTFAVYQSDTSLSTPDTVFNIRMRSAGPAINHAAPAPLLVKDHVKHFYLPHTAPNGATHVKGHDIVQYSEFIKDVDLFFHSGSGGMKMTLKCRPGFNPLNVVLGFLGQDSLRVDITGALKMWSNGKYITLRQALAFQVDDNGDLLPLNWNAEYQPNDNMGIVRFLFSSYDPERPLYLQAGPEPWAANESDGLCWSSYLGGNNEDYIVASGVDSVGNYFVTGRTLSQYPTFPNNLGYSLSVAGSQPVFVSGFNAQHQLRWSAYYGGNAYGQGPYAMAVRTVSAEISHIYVGGGIFSTSLFYQALNGAYNNSNGAGGGVQNGYLARFDRDGILEWSTYFGNANTRVWGLAIDAENRLVVVGTTQGAVPLPATQPSGSYTQGLSGGSDGFVVALDENHQPRWGTYIGGTGFDEARAVRCQGDRIIVLGSTNSPNFQPIYDGGPNAYDQPTFGGAIDLTLSEFTLGGARVWSTWFGTSDFETISGANPLDMDAQGNILIIADAGPNLPIVPGVGWHQYAESDQMLLEFGPDRDRIWTTYLGAGSGQLRAECVRADAKGNIYVAGRAIRQPNYPDFPIPATTELADYYYQPDMITGDPDALGPFDGFLLSWTPDHWLAIATYFGGEEWGLPLVGGISYIEGITTLSPNDQYLYVAGYTSKVLIQYPDSSFFPLYDPGGDAWFQAHFNAQVPGTGAADGIVTAFCIDAFTGLPHLPASRTKGQPTVVRLAPDQWRLDGLAPGTYALCLHDALGRLVQRSALRVSAGQSDAIETGNLAAGTYLLLLLDAKGEAVGRGVKLPIHR